MLFNWTATITVMQILHSLGCNETKAHVVSGGVISYWFFYAMVPHWFKIHRYMEVGEGLYQSLGTLLHSLLRHCSSSMFFWMSGSALVHSLMRQALELLVRPICRNWLFICLIPSDMSINLFEVRFSKVPSMPVLTQPLLEYFCIILFDELEKK